MTNNEIISKKAISIFKESRNITTINKQRNHLITANTENIEKIDTVYLILLSDFNFNTFKEYNFEIWLDENLNLLEIKKID